jgi:hypothetical protein
MTKTLELILRFFENKKLHDRVQTVSDIEDILLDKGRLGMLLGCKNAGKSFMLCDIQRRLNKGNKVLVLYIDMREHGSDIIFGLVKALQTSHLHAEFFNTLKSNAGAICSDFIRDDAFIGSNVFAPCFSIRSLIIQFWTYLEKTHANETLHIHIQLLALLLDTFIQTSQSKGLFPCLIIDEANKTLQARTPQEKLESLQTLHMFVSRTKQRCSMNVLLTSSHHEEPDLLAKIGFKSSDIQSVVYMGEVPPRDMRKLLQNEWGLGPNMHVGLWRSHFHHRAGTV